MESQSVNDRRIADRLRTLRAERGWSLDQLAERSGVSRASLSRIENGEVSPTANVLGRLAAAHGLTVSRLIYLAEDNHVALVRRGEQAEWQDRPAGFRRRSVSPPSRSLAGEALECLLEPGAHIAYDDSPRPGLEHHLFLLEGGLTVDVAGEAHALEPGDCLRYRLDGPSAFTAAPRDGARYVLFMV